jgi:hypothetical protein
MNQVKLINLFVSCPSDIKEELASIKFIIDEINKTSGRQNSFRIDFLNWAIDTYSQIGEDAQDVINNQIEPLYDIIVGIIWQKIGTQTKRDKSGTIEELNRAINNKDKEFLIYFKTTPPDSLNEINIDNFVKVKEYKNDLSNKGVLYKEFNTINSFENIFRINILNLINDKILNSKKYTKESLNLSSKLEDKYQSISEIIKSIETKDELNLNEIDILELSDNVVLSFDLISSSMASMTSALKVIGDKLTLRSNQLNKLLSIKDNKLRIGKTQAVVDVLAVELLDFKRKMETEKDILNEHFLSIVPKYSQIMQYQKLFHSSNEVDLKGTLLSFRDSVEGATQECANLLKIVSTWPPVYPKFNNSKREVENVLKDITKIFLGGLQLLDEALEI